MLIYSRRQLDPCKLHLKTQVWKRTKLMKLYWSEDQAEFLRLDKSLKTFSMEKNQILVSTLMRQYAMEQLFKVVLFVVKNLMRPKDSLLLMPHPSVWVLRLLVESWPKLFPKDHTFLLKNHKFLLHIKIINKQLLSQYLREKDL